ncbi:hypothetical protein PHLCEN_2v8956 [Hermanssonia centrifuga]|uniref:HIG1 domain-containing protein n=1 Tax=Hermanssonia centrifuga TaxID=98765 RepID=A0A2R6NS18_9APHY|nr:hypothetical protein PHLCEN_2v8956 [Hermanssonia centrifuga]
MSVVNVATTGRSVNEHKAETWQQKLLRRFKEEPLVPIGVFATCVALVMAASKLGKPSESMSMNRWMRVRVIAQGATIAAIVGGSYFYKDKQQQPDAITTAEETKMKEKLEFEARMRAAEETHALEAALQREKEEKSKSIWRRFGLGYGKSSTPKDATPAAAPVAPAAVTTPPPKPISAPAVENPSPPRTESIWSWLGLSGAKASADASKKVGPSNAETKV